jgi:hypothetical protein
LAFIIERIDKAIYIMNAEDYILPGSSEPSVTNNNKFSDYIVYILIGVVVILIGLVLYLLLTGPDEPQKTGGKGPPVKQRPIKKKPKEVVKEEAEEEEYEEEEPVKSHMTKWEELRAAKASKAEKQNRPVNPPVPVIEIEDDEEVDQLDE